MKRGEYDIPFTGLKDEVHQFTFKIGKAFFELLEYSEISDADLNVIVALDKRENMMLAEFKIEGKVVTTCDRCTDVLTLDINCSEELIYKFGDAELDDEKIIVVHSNDISINVQHPIYEFSILQLPSKKTHEEGKCNQEMMAALDQYLIVETENDDLGSEEDEEDDTDPRWNELRNLK